MPFCFWASRYHNRSIRKGQSCNSKKTTTKTKDDSDREASDGRCIYPDHYFRARISIVYVASVFVYLYRTAGRAISQMLTSSESRKPIPTPSLFEIRTVPKKQRQSVFVAIPNILQPRKIGLAGVLCALALHKFGSCIHLGPTRCRAHIYK